MISIEITPAIVNNSPEQSTSNIKTLFDILPKDDIEFQAIIKSNYFDQHLTEVEIPLNNKTLTLLLKLPENLLHPDKISFYINHLNNTITLHARNNTSESILQIKLSENFLKMQKADFFIKNIRIADNINTNNSSSVNLPQAIQIKAVEILPSEMIGKQYEAFILKDIPSEIRKNLTPDAKEFIKEAQSNNTDSISSKLLVEIKGIHPPSNEISNINNPIIKEADHTVLSTKEIISILKGNKSKSWPNLQSCQIGNNFTDNILCQNKKTNSFFDKISPLFKSVLATKNGEEPNIIINGIIISKPEDISQKILISDVGIITVPDLKEKLPFKSIIDIQIKNIISPDKITDEYISVDNTPYNSIKRIIHELKNNELLHKFTANLPTFNKHFLTKTVKYIKAINSHNPNIIFHPDLLTEIENEIGEKNFLIEMLRKDFIKPLNIKSPDSNNQFSMYVLPLINNNNISTVWLYLFTPQSCLQNKETRNDEKEKKNRNKQRFLLELELSELGDLQFEGLVDIKNHTMDMQIKSNYDFSENEKKELNQIYIDSMITLNYIGELKFAVKEKLFKPFEKIKNGYYI